MVSVEVSFEETWTSLIRNKRQFHKSSLCVMIKQTFTCIAATEGVFTFSLWFPAKLNMRLRLWTHQRGTACAPAGCCRTGTGCHRHHKCSVLKNHKAHKSVWLRQRRKLTHCLSASLRYPWATLTVGSESSSPTRWCFSKSCSTAWLNKLQH